MEAGRHPQRRKPTDVERGQLREFIAREFPDPTEVPEGDLVGFRDSILLALVAGENPHWSFLDLWGMGDQRLLRLRHCREAANRLGY
jgi:hypothetical protein